MADFIFNGKFFKEGDAVISSANRGLRYGDGLFETMKMKEDRTIFEEDHLERLWHGMQVLKFEIPGNFTKQKLIESIKKLAEKNHHQKWGRIRLNVFRSEGGLYDAVNHYPNYIIETWELPETSGEWNSNGLVCGLFEDGKKSCDIISNIKNNNYLLYALAALKAKEEKWNDAFVLNQFGNVSDSTIANVFIIKNKTIHTPALTEGCVAGVLRKNLLQYLHKNNFNVQETKISVDDLLNADEVFVTNSINNIRWVQQVQDSSYSNELTSKIYNGFISTIY